MIDHPLPEIIRPVLDDYLAQMDVHLPGLLDGFYLVGSIVLDGYAAKFSDIDYVAVLAHPLSSIELDRLAQVHRQIENTHPGSKMSGSYLQAADLGRLPEQIAPHPYYQDGRLHPAGQYALAHLPPHWRRLIQEALRIRRGGKPSFYRCRLSRALEARKFLLYIIQTCSSEFEA